MRAGACLLLCVFLAVRAMVGLAAVQDCTSPTFTKGKFAVPVDRDAVRADWISRGYSYVDVKPYGPGWSRGEHTHPVHLIITLVAGRMEFLLTGQRFVEPGDELCYPAYTVHSASNLHGGTTQMLEGSKR